MRFTKGRRMYSFIVLGLVPGTNFQITFQVWLDVVLVAVMLALLIGIYRQRPVFGYLITRYSPLDASLLHRRSIMTPIKRRHYAINTPFAMNWLQPVQEIGRRVAALPAGIAGLL